MGWARIMFVYARELHFYVLSASWGTGCGCASGMEATPSVGTLHYITAGCQHAELLPNRPKAPLQWSKIAFDAADGA